MIGQNPKAEVAPFFVGGNRDKEISFEEKCRREQWGESSAKLRAKKQNRNFQANSWGDKIYWNCRRNYRGKAERILNKRNLCLQAKAIYKKPG